MVLYINYTNLCDPYGVVVAQTLGYAIKFKCSFLIVATNIENQNACQCDNILPIEPITKIYIKYTIINKHCTT
jgi:hypothetical protein